jgi:hypothetical protein
VTPSADCPDAASAEFSFQVVNRAALAADAADGVLVATITKTIAAILGVLATTVVLVAFPTAEAMAPDDNAKETAWAVLVLLPRLDTVIGTVTKGTLSLRRLPTSKPTAMEALLGRRFAAAAEIPVVEKVPALMARVNVVLTVRSLTTTVTNEEATPATPATLLATTLGENVAELMPPS